MYQQDDDTVLLDEPAAPRTDSNEQQPTDDLEINETKTLTATHKEHEIIATVFIDPKYQFQANWEDECILRVLEETCNVIILFNDANYKMIIHGLPDNIKLCKADIDLDMSARCWWDEEPSEAMFLSNTATDNVLSEHVKAAPTKARCAVKEKVITSRRVRVQRDRQ